MRRSLKDCLFWNAEAELKVYQGEKYTLKIDKIRNIFFYILVSAFLICVFFCVREIVYLMDSVHKEDTFFVKAFLMAIIGVAVGMLYNMVMTHIRANLL